MLLLPESFELSSLPGSRARYLLWAQPCIAYSGKIQWSSLLLTLTAAGSLHIQGFFNLPREPVLLLLEVLKILLVELARNVVLPLLMMSGVAHLCNHEAICLGIFNNLDSYFACAFFSTTRGCFAAYSSRSSPSLSSFLPEAERHSGITLNGLSLKYSFIMR